MKKMALFIIAFFTLMNLYSQEQENRKPKIGLVLSGGGAKGFAHIGVLKVLEKAGVKIDYIGGTSMGAVVGGLYASGYKASQIDSIFKTTNFDNLLSDYIPRSSKNFYEKRNDEMYAFSLPFNKLKIGIPTSISKGIYNYNLLNKLTYKVRHIRDFNQLSIPFFCIATDIETGEDVTLNKGYLAQAMLASSAFPTLFSPVEINGRLLVDGGVTNNFPVDEIKKLGADIIIGVDVQDDLKDRKSLKDATKILVQISNLQMIEKLKQKIKDIDIYIPPDISDFSVISFDEGQAIVQKGEEAAFAQYEKIIKLGDSTKVNTPNSSMKPDSLDLNFINIKPLKNYTRSYIIGKLRFKPNSKITYEDLKIGINNLMATQNFNTISYTIEKDKDKDDLLLDLSENPNKTFLKFALHYDGLYKSGFLVNLTQKKALFKNDITSLDLVLGDNLRYNFDYYIDNGFYWSFGLKSRFSTFNRNTKNDFNESKFLNILKINSINIDYSDLTNQAYMQTIFIQKFLIGTGLEWKHLKIKSKTIENATSVFENSDYASIFGYLKYDSLDNKYFPKTGWYFSSDFQTYFYSSNFSGKFNKYSIAKSDLEFARTIFKSATFKFNSEAGFVVGKESNPYLDFALGGYGFNPVNNFRPFYGYDFLSISGDSYIKSTLTVDYEIFKKNHINLSANYANMEDHLFDSSKWFTKVRYSGYAVGYGIESILGPVEFKYSWSPELGKGFAWFAVGFWF